MRCPSCSTENEASSKFCRECGSRLVLACASCGTTLAPGSKFCPECGAAQGDGAALAAAAAPGASERRLVSVLFTDLVGFTTLSEARDPEETRDLLDRYFALARQTIERYGGTIEKFIGDAVMAVWGTPTAHEDDAERAVRAALDLVEGVNGLGADLGVDGLALRAGVLTGEAAVALDAEGQGMVAGDLVNTAARLQAAAPPGTVLVGDSTRRATEGAIAYEEAGEQILKGKASPVPAHRALRIVARRRGEGRSDGIEPPFVGRDAELRLLKDLFHATGEERRPRLISVLGQAGIGKSRLAWELFKYVDGVTELAYWHHGRCPAYGDGVAFWALGEMVRRRAGIGEVEADDASREKLAATLEEFVTDAAERSFIQPRLEQLLGLAGEAGAAGQDTIFAAWRTFFERVSERGTVVMIFEDLHWADPGLLDFIEHVLDWSRGHPIYILALARHELLQRRSDWGLARRNALSLPLEPLADAAMRQLMAGLVPGLPEATVRGILARAEGIPLYAVETVRMLINDGRVEAADGAYRPVGELGNVAIPESLHALIAARLDALDPADRRLLQAASVLGRTFTVEAAAAVTGEEAPALDQQLRDLVRRELLAIDADPRSPERGQYGFVQALIREVALSTLSRRDRRRLHLAAAQHFEGLGDDELAGVLASHYVAAYEAQPDGAEGEAVAAQARVTLRAAAERALRLASPLQAHSYLLQALPVTRRPAERAELLEAAGLAAGRAGLEDPAVDHAEEALELRRALGEREPILRATTLLGTVLLWGSDPLRAAKLLEPAAAEFGDLGATPEYVELAGELTRAYMRTGRDEEAIALADRILPAAERLSLIEDTLEILVNRGTALTNLDRMQEGAATLLGAIALARLHELPSVEIRSIINLSFAAEADEPRVSQTRHGLELMARYGMRQFLTYLLGNAVTEAVTAGDWDWAEATVTEYAVSAVDDAERDILGVLPIDIEMLRGVAGVAELEEKSRVFSSQDPQHVAALHGAHALLALAEGRFDDVHRHAMDSHAALPSIGLVALTYAGHAAVWAADRGRAEQVRDLVKERSGRIARNHLRVLEAGIAALEGRTAEAIALYRPALARWREVNYRLPLVLAEIGMVSTLDPALPEARDAADEARAILTELRAERLLGLLDRQLAARGAPSTAHRPASPVGS